MRKNYTRPEIETLDFTVLDIITLSASVLEKLDEIVATPGGNDPSLEDGIDL